MVLPNEFIWPKHFTLGFLIVNLKWIIMESILKDGVASYTSLNMARCVSKWREKVIALLYQLNLILYLDAILTRILCETYKNIVLNIRSLYF